MFPHAAPHGHASCVNRGMPSSKCTVQSLVCVLHTAWHGPRKIYNVLCVRAWKQALLATPRAGEAQRFSVPPSL